MKENQGGCARDYLWEEALASVERGMVVGSVVEVAAKAVLSMLSIPFIDACFLRRWGGV